MIAALIPDDGILDDIAIERVIEGGTARLTRLERLAVIERMTERGYSAARIAERVGCAGRTITRTRTRMRNAPAHFAEASCLSPGGNFPQSPGNLPAVSPDDERFEIPKWWFDLGERARPRPRVSRLQSLHG